MMSKNKKGVLGLDTAVSFILVLLTLVLVAFASIVAVSILSSTAILPAGSAGANATATIFSNFTAGVNVLFANTTTWMAVLGVVITLLILGLIIFAVRRFAGNGMSVGASG